LQRVGQRDVLDDELGEIEAEGGEGGLDLLADLRGEGGFVGGEIEEGEVAGGKDLGHAGDDGVAQLVFEVGDAVALARAADLGEEGRGGSTMR